MERERSRNVAPSLSARAFWLHMGGTVAAGAALVAWSADQMAGSDVRRLGSGFAVVALLVVLAELRPLFTAGSKDVNGVVLSTAFVYAMLLHWGLAVAVLMQALATLVADQVQRRAPWRTAFNIGQYTLSWAAAALVLAVAGRAPTPAHPLSVHGSDLPAIIAAAVAYFVVNDLLVARALALRNRRRLREEFFDEFGYQVLTNGALLGLAPIVVLTLEHGPALVPLLLLPLTAVYASAAVSVEKEHQALHDTLTGLPNRTCLLQRAGDALSESARTARPMGLVLLDLDRFKEVNDTLGHHVGDALLQLVGRRLCTAVRPGDTVARLGGDEFAVLLPDLRDEAAALEVAERIRASLDRPFEHDGTVFDVAASLGVALHPAHGADVATLMQRADVAMYVAKESGGGVQGYRPDRDFHSASRLGVLWELRQALERREVELHYQPKADMRTGEVVGVEALLRWHRPGRGMLPPAEFLPLAERSGLMRLVTRFVVDTALDQLACWWRAGLCVGMAVNVSASDLYDAEFVRHLERRLRETGTPPTALQLEITEGVLMVDPELAGQTLAAVTSLGVGVSLDDFGTGYSSLVRLKRLPVSEIKIDRSFVQGMAVDPDDAVIVRSIVELSAALGLRVVAEGVETRPAWEQLRSFGCDAAQGWYLAAAMPAGQATAWLRQARATRPVTGPSGVSA